MKQRVRIQYGVAATVRLGSMRDPTTGQTVTPTFVAGDITITQDDGSGVDNIDALPTMDGSDVPLAISATEASPASGQYGRRVVKIYDQTVPAVWLDCDVIIETENHHLATYPNGVLRGFTPQAVSAAGVTFDAAAETTIDPTGMVVVIAQSDEPLDVGHAGTVTSWTAGTQVAVMEDGWTRTPTGTAANIRCAAYAQPPTASASAGGGDTQTVIDGLTEYGAAKASSKQGQGAAVFT